MRMRIDVAGERAAEEARSLLEELRWEPGVSAALHPGPPGPDEPARFVESMVVGLTSPSLIRVLARVVSLWLGRQHRSVSLTITTEDNRRTLDIRHGDTTEQVVERLSSLIDAGNMRGVSEGGHDGDTATPAVQADEVVYYSDGYSGISKAQANAQAEAEVAARRVRESARYLSNSLSFPVTIYLSDEEGHEQVEAAVEDLLALAGLRVEGRDDPVVGSWFRRMRAGIRQAARSPAAKEGALIAAHVADTRLVLAQDAAVTATLMQNLGPVITSLQPTKDAVIRLGAVLIVKVDWVVAVHQLTAVQQVVLDHQPGLVMAPREIVAALDAAVLKASEAAFTQPSLPAGLPDDFVMSRHDMPPEPDSAEQNQNLPLDARPQQSGSSES